MTAPSDPRSDLSFLVGIDAVCFDAFGTLVEIGDRRRPLRPVLRCLDRDGRRNLIHAALRSERSLEALLAGQRGTGGSGAGKGPSGRLRIVPDAPAAPQAPVLPPDVLAAYREALAAEVASVRLRSGVTGIWAALRGRGLLIGVCSNLAAPYVRPLMACLPDRPDAVVLSCEAGVAKPEPAIYRAVCEGFGMALAGGEPGLMVHPSRVLFVGDTPSADVDGPRAYGMRAMLIGAFEQAIGNG